MSETNPEQINGNITITLQPQDNGQNKEHAIAIALETLASEYRQIAEQQQHIDWDERSYDEFDEPILKQYHVILHYERIAEEECKFEALHNTIVGNTAVEYAKITLVEIEPDLPVKLNRKSLGLQEPL